MIPQLSSISRRGFTLVELLVVVAVIAVLLSIMLPSMSRIRDLAKKATCASDRRENYYQVLASTQDHDDALPGEPLANGKLYNHKDKFHAALKDFKFAGVYPLGQLAMGQYVDDPEQYFCPAFERPRPTFRAWDLNKWYYDQPDFLAKAQADQSVPWGGISGRFWEGQANPDFWYEKFAGPSPSPSIAFAGITTYFRAFWNYDPNYNTNDYDGTSPNHHFGAEIKLMDVMTRWDETSVDTTRSYYGGYSPVLVSCADYGRYEPDHHYQASTEWTRTSHKRQGLNAAFFDGSVRWIPRSIYTSPAGNNVIDLNAGHTNPNDMQEWFRRYARP